MIKKYEHYKDSGVEWLGEIPEHWNTLPIRAIFEERNEKNDGRKTDFILSVTKDRGVIPYEEKGAIGNNKSEDIERYKLVYPNDFVINKMNVVIGSLGMSKYFGAFSQVYLVYRPKTEQINMNYYSYLFSNPSFYKSLIKYCKGIMELRESLDKNDFKKLILPFPEINVQTKIAQFLDDKTTKIDQAIAIKQQQIALLKERKQILIHKAVTGQLIIENGKWIMTPKEKMKDSGVQWIGEIPEHWEVARVKQCSNKISKGTTPSTEGRDILAEGKIRFLKSENIFEGFITEKPLFFIDEKTDFIMKRSSLEVNDVLFVIAGASLGKVAIITEDILPANTNQAVAFVRPNKKIHPSFLSKYLISSTINELTWLEAVQSAQPNLSMDSLGNFPISLPPLIEQKEISDYIETSSHKIDTAISLKTQEIEKLKEYKSSLINSVVTGKVKIIENGKLKIENGE